MYRWHEVVSGSWSSWASPFPAAGPTTYSQPIGITLQWRSNHVKSYRYIKKIEQTATDFLTCMM